MTMEIGFIGLGNMGTAMARNLLRAGHRLTVYNRTRGKAAALAQDGAAIAERPGDACGGEAVITMLADDAALEAVVGGSDGVLAGLNKGAIHLAMSTISPALADRLTAAHAELGQHYVAAPVLGRPEAAAAAKLFILAAGPEEVVARCKPLFETLGQHSFTIGSTPSQANLVKLSCNFLIAAMLESVGEAVALVRKGGIDAHRFTEILTSSLFAAPVYKTYGPIIADEKYAPAGFAMALGLKDIRLALAAADHLAVPLPTASLVHDNFLSGIAQGQRDLDWSALAGIAAKRAGL
jgi:3-hydroxyisobutyrate dehydrogenase-like beta-hydroxyacid dehydrogenase